VDGIALVLFSAIFLLGAKRQRAEIAALAMAGIEIREATQDRADVMQSWSTLSSDEPGIWSAVEGGYADAVQAGDIRLSFSLELARLATRCGIEDLRLVESEDESDWGDEDGYALTDGEEGGAEFGEDEWEEDDWENEDEWDEWSDEGDDEVKSVVVVTPHEFALEFHASYDSLVRFIGELRELTRVVEARRVWTSRDGPLLTVRMTLATYGRTM